MSRFTVAVMTTATTGMITTATDRAKVSIRNKRTLSGALFLFVRAFI